MAKCVFDLRKALKIVEQNEELIWKAERATTCRDPEAWHFICPLCPRKCIIHVCESGDTPDPTIEVQCPKNPNWLVSIPPEGFDPDDYDPCKHCIDNTMCQDM